MTSIDIHRHRTIAADPARVWDIVADLDGYHAHARRLTDSRVLAGNGVGARRSCTDTAGATWEETVTDWRPGHRFTIEVDTATYPWRLRSVMAAVRGTWEVEPRPDGNAVVHLRFQIEARRQPGAGLLLRAVAGRFAAEMDDVLASYARRLESDAGRGRAGRAAVTPPGAPRGDAARPH